MASPSVHIRPEGPDKLLPSQGAQHNRNNLQLEALAHKVLHMMMLHHWIGKCLINSPAPQLSSKFIKQVIICFDVLNGGVGGEVCSPQDPSLAGCEWTKTAKKQCSRDPPGIILEGMGYGKIGHPQNRKTPSRKMLETLQCSSSLSQQSASDMASFLPIVWEASRARCRQMYRVTVRP